MPFCESSGTTQDAQGSARSSTLTRRNRGLHRSPGIENCALFSSSTAVTPPSLFSARSDWSTDLLPEHYSSDTLPVLLSQTSDPLAQLRTLLSAQVNCEALPGNVKELLTALIVEIQKDKPSIKACLLYTSPSPRDS